ncbi:hypothetical protein POM88_036890 [Heracleum sosnowskyi]|uniref:RecA-like N-terminal domain-containing protein n=1 Tax=Heracleum sosnowskyi TaxID=360622 RepID=A0AAD8HQX6_9APIA|nr:hypothetical protein POM88_036890 [Heracleum sosnowskyi]
MFFETFPCGCLTLDFALGGGLPQGRIVEINGPESSGKSTLALHMIPEVQVLCFSYYCCSWKLVYYILQHAEIWRKNQEESQHIRSTGISSKITWFALARRDM